MKDAYTDILKDYEKAKAKERDEIESEIELAIKSCLDTHAGQVLIWWLCSITGVFLPTYTGNSDTYFNEGRRAVGLELAHRVVRVNPGAFLKMIQAGEAKT